MEHQIIISGSGGQGVVLGGIILAEAAAIYDDKNATHNQSYGPEARGGASKSEVIISDGPIHFPEIECSNVLVALTQAAVDKFGRKVTDNGMLIVDSRVKEIPKQNSLKVYSLPISDSSIELAGNEMVTNMVALGALASLTGLVSKDALRKAIIARVPKGTSELNLRAMDMGFHIAEQVI